MIEAAIYFADLSSGSWKIILWAIVMFLIVGVIAAIASRQ